MRRARILAPLLTALLAPVLVTTCADEEAAGTQAPAIEGVPWVLESGAGSEAGGPAPTATFEAGRVTGTTGCNRYSGTYVVDGGRISIEPGATTLKGCPPPADEVERGYLAALGRVSGWRTERDELVLLAEGAPALRFRAASPEGSWTVTSFANGDAVTSPIPGTELTATFAADGTLSGSAGCNAYTATYTTTDGSLTISPPASTRKLCEEPEGAMDQEAAYLAALPEAARFQLGEHGLGCSGPTGRSWRPTRPGRASRGQQLAGPRVAPEAGARTATRGAPSRGASRASAATGSRPGGCARGSR